MPQRPHWTRRRRRRPPRAPHAASDSIAAVAGVAGVAAARLRQLHGRRLLPCHAAAFCRPTRAAC
eukprot:363490-Chlamydomonas_euryale.AAC.15